MHGKVGLAAHHNHLTGGESKFSSEALKSIRGQCGQHFAAIQQISANNIAGDTSYRASNGSAGLLFVVVVISLDQFIDGVHVCCWGPHQV